MVPTLPFTDDPAVAAIIADNKHQAIEIAGIKTALAKMAVRYEVALACANAKTSRRREMRKSCTAEKTTILQGK